MIVKKISYEDFDGNQRVEEHRFHLSKHELALMEMTTEGGLEHRMRRMVQEKNPKELAKIFVGIIEQSYGIKSDDGKRFEKSPEAYKEFMSTGAYDALFMEMATDEDALITFINGILPKDMQDEIKKNGGINKDTIQKYLDENM